MEMVEQKRCEEQRRRKVVREAAAARSGSTTAESTVESTSTETTSNTAESTAESTSTEDLVASLQGSQAFHEMVKGIVLEMGMGIVRETFTQTIRPAVTDAVAENTLKTVDAVGTGQGKRRSNRQRQQKLNPTPKRVRQQ